jgi:probable phosphoglycerate mutase
MWAIGATIPLHFVPTPVTRILVLRHGESTWNAEGRWQGQADPPLSPRGEQQAHAAAAQLDPVDVVVASDLRRAARTAVIIAAELGDPPLVFDERLRERHAGDWQGLTRAEVEAGWPGFLEGGRRPNGFERSVTAAERAMTALLDVAARHPGAVALAVTHGGILRAIRKVLGTIDDIGFANLAGQWFTVSGTDVVGGELVSLLHADRPSPLSPL